MPRERWRAKIGIINPGHGAQVLEEFESAAPKGVAFAMASLGKPAGLNVKIVEDMIPRLEQAARELSHEAGVSGLEPYGGVEAIIQCGTPLGFVHGIGSDKDLIKRIERVAGVPATTHMTSIVEALQKLQVGKLVVVAPYYPDELINKLQKFLDASGFNVVAITSLAEKPEIVATLPYGVYRPAKRFFMAAPQADGLLLCGGAARSFQILEAMEQDIRKPVTSSNQAGLWKVLNLVNVREPIPCYGQLLRTF